MEQRQGFIPLPVYHRVMFSQGRMESCSLHTATDSMRGLDSGKGGGGKGKLSCDFSFSPGFGCEMWKRRMVAGHNGLISSGKSINGIHDPRKPLQQSFNFDKILKSAIDRKSIQNVEHSRSSLTLLFHAHSSKPSRL